MSLSERFQRFNAANNDIPRRLILIAGVVVAGVVVLLLLPLLWPFALALLFALVLEPFIKLLSEKLGKLRVGRVPASLLGMLILFGVLGVVIVFALNRLVRELISLAESVPSFITWVSDTALPWVRQLSVDYQDVLPFDLVAVTESLISEMSSSLVTMAKDISLSLAGGAWATAMSLPRILLSIVLTIMATYYLSADRERILGFFRRTLPKRVQDTGVLLKKNIFRALFGQARSQMLVSLLITISVMAGLVIMRKPYALLIGLLIGVADALPVVGAGLFLIPWSIVGFVTGDMATGVGMALLYVATIVVRQVFEPRIVGRNLGLYPLATMMAMYAGFQLIGFLGMLVGPVMLNIIMVVLRADAGRIHPPAGVGDVIARVRTRREVLRARVKRGRRKEP